MRHPPELSPHSWANLEVVEGGSPVVPLSPADHTPRHALMRSSGEKTHRERSLPHFAHAKQFQLQELKS